MANQSDGGQPIALFVSVAAMVAVAVAGIALASPETSNPSQVRYVGTYEPLNRGPSPEPTVDAQPSESPTSGPMDSEEADGLSRENLTYLQETLGAEYVIEGDELVAQTAEGLPPEVSALATVTVLPDNGQPFACPAADPQGSCTERSLSDGSRILLEKAGPIHSAAGSNFGALTVRCERANGATVVVQMSVLGRPSGGSTPQLEDAVTDWLKSMQDRLIAAAQDNRMIVPSA